MKNFSWAANLRCLPAALARNLLVLFAVMLKERSSWPALKSVWALRKVAARKHQAIFQRRRCSPAEIGSWFSFRPVHQTSLAAIPAAKPIRQILAIVINYSAGERLRRCLESLNTVAAQLTSALEFKVEVIDNSQHDNSARALAMQFAENRRFNFDFPGKNLGFAGAINRSWAKTRQSSDLPDALLILNPDVELNAHAVEELVGALNAHDNLAIAAPILKGPDDSLQLDYSLRCLPTLSTQVSDLLLLPHLWPNSPWTTKIRSGATCSRAAGEVLLPEEKVGEPFAVEQPAFACVLMRSDCFEKLAGMDERFFPAWYEDVDYCERVRRASLSVAVCPRARVLHEGGYSFSELRPAETLRPFYENQLRYFRKHLPRGQFLIFRLIFVIGMLLRSILSLARAFQRLFSGHEDSHLHAARAHIFWQLIYRRQTDSNSQAVRPERE